jgi:hypothetical protein
MSALLFTRTPIAAGIAAFVLVGCATGPDGKMRLDPKAQGALMGAAAGCALGAATGGDCVKGAVIGAVAGFLISWYFESKKVAEAKVVNQEYDSSKDKAKPKPPKNDVVPAAFTAQVKPGKVEASGEKEVQITSNTDLIGYGDKVPEVTQKYAIYDENNKLVEEKSEKITAVDGAGRYETSSKFKLPASAKGKTYTVKTELASNGKTYKQNSYKVAFVDDGQMMILAMAR